MNDGIKFSTYTIEEPLGSGAFGKVFRAVNKNGERVALKFYWIYTLDELEEHLRALDSNNPGGQRITPARINEMYAEDKQNFEQPFNTEHQLGRTLTSRLREENPAWVDIPEYFDLQIHQELRFIEMEFIAFPTVDAVLQSTLSDSLLPEVLSTDLMNGQMPDQTRLPEVIALEITCRFLNVLKLLHQHEARYLRDAQFKNYTIDPSSYDPQNPGNLRLKILDWNGTLPIVGDRMYESPGGHDQWKAIAFLYHMLTGVELPSAALRLSYIERLAAERWSAISSPTRAIIKRILSTPVGIRDFDTQGLMNALRQIQEQLLSGELVAAAGSNNRGNELVDTLRNRLKNNQSAEIIDLSIFDMDDRQLGLQDLRWKKAFDALKAIANDLLADEIDRWGEEFADVLTQLEALTSEKTTDKHLLSQQLVTGQYTQNRIIRSDKVPAKLQQAVADLRKEIKLYALWYEDFTADADRGISLHTLGDPAQTGYTRNILQKAEAQIHQVISQWSDIEDAHYQKLIALHLAQLDDEQLPQFLEDALPDGASIFRDIETGIKKRIAQFQQTDKNKAKYENVLALISARQADRAATELRDLLRKNPTDTGHRETLKATLDEMFDAALQQDLSDAASFIRIIEPDLRYASTYHDDDIKISDYHRKIRARVAGQIQNNVGGLINALATRKIIVLDTLSGLTTLTDNERQQLGDNLSEDLYNSELPSASSRSQLDLLLNNIEVFEKRIVAEFDETAFSDTWQHWKNKYTHEFESWLKDKLTKSRKLDHTLWMVTALKQLRAISSSQNAHNTVEDYSTLENLLNELYDVQYYDEETAPLVDQTGILSQQLGLNLGYLEMITEAPPPPPEPEAAPVSEVPGNSRRQPAPGILIGIVTVFVLIAGVALFALSQATSDTEAASSTETAIAQAQANITPVITAEIIPETLTHTPTETVTDAPTETPTIAPSPTEIPPTLIPLSPGDDAITVAGKDSSLTFNVLENDAGSNYSLSQLNLSDDFEYDAISMIEVSRSDKIGELIVTVIDVNGTDKIETFADIITDEPLVIGYTISNPKDGGEASASLTINLNSLPVVPQNITVDTDEDTSVLINLIGEDRIDTQENRIIGLNITDADGETIVLDLDNTAPPRSISGTLDVVSDTQLRYTPNENVNGGDTILFKITDATDSINVSIPVTINAINDAPIVNNEAINAQKITTNEDTPFSFDGLAYVTDVDVDDVDDAGDTLSIQLMSDQLLQRGSLEQDPANPDRIIYTPSPDYFGQDTIRYSVIDSADQRIEVTLDIDVVSVLDLNEINPPVIDVSLPDYIAPLFDQFTMPYKVRYPGPLAFDGNDSTKIIIDIETNIIAGRDVPMGDRPGEEIIHRNGPRLSIHGRYLDTERETWYFVSVDPAGNVTNPANSGWISRSDLQAGNISNADIQLSNANEALDWVASEIPIIALLNDGTAEITGFETLQTDDKAPEATAPILSATPANGVVYILAQRAAPDNTVQYLVAYAEVENGSDDATDNNEEGENSEPAFSEPRFMWTAATNFSRTDEFENLIPIYPQIELRILEDFTNIRNSPTIDDSGVITQLDAVNLYPVAVFNQNGDVWYLVKIPDTETYGWISATVVEVVGGNASLLPVYNSEESPYPIGEPPSQGE